MSFPDPVNFGLIQPTCSSSLNTTQGLTDSPTQIVQVQSFAQPFFANGIEEPTFPKPRYYKKGEEKTKDLVPISREIGCGDSGIVYQHAKDPHLLVKKDSHRWGDGNFKREYKIGIRIDHDNIMKTYQLFIKQNPSKEDKQSLVIEKINGHEIISRVSKNRSYSPETISKLMGQVKSCLDYLFDKGISWNYLSGRNILLTDDTYDLKFIDLGGWGKLKDFSKDKNKNYTDFGVQLFFNGLAALKAVLGLHKLEKTQSDAILFTNKFFKIPLSTSENKFKDATYYFQFQRDGDNISCPFCNYFEEELQKMGNNPEKIRAFFKSYFETVEKEFLSL